jgi:hypothetical protein
VGAVVPGHRPRGQRTHQRADRPQPDAARVGPAEGVRVERRGPGPAAARARAGRRLRRHGLTQAGAGHPDQRGAVRYRLRAGEPGSHAPLQPDARGDGPARGLPAPLPRLRRDPHVRVLGLLELPRAPGRGHPPFRPGPHVRGDLHVEQGPGGRQRRLQLRSPTGPRRIAGRTTPTSRPTGPTTSW